MLKSKLLLSIGILIAVILPVAPAYSQSKDTKEKVSMDVLPEEMKSVIKKKYKKYEVNNLFRKTKDKVSYIAELQKKKRLVRLYYDEDGNFLRKEKTKVFSFEESLEPRDNPGENQHQPFPNF